MKKALQYIRTTIVGGAVFVIPLLLGYFILHKSAEIFGPIINPILDNLHIETLIGAAAGTLVTLLSLLLASFLCGLLAHTMIGQSMIRWLQASVVSLLPRFHLMQGLAGGMNNDQTSDISVVLVPTDAGWTLALQLEQQHGDWCTVYIPGAPQWASGTVAFAHIDDVHPVDMPLGRSLLMIRRCGMGSAEICRVLTELKARGTI